MDDKSLSEESKIDYLTPEDGAGVPAGGVSFDADRAQMLGNRDEMTGKVPVHNRIQYRDGSWNDAYSGEGTVDLNAATMHIARETGSVTAFAGVAFYLAAREEDTRWIFDTGHDIAVCVDKATGNVIQQYQGEVPTTIDL